MMTGGQLEPLQERKHLLLPARDMKKKMVKRIFREINLKKMKTKIYI